MIDIKPKQKFTYQEPGQEVPIPTPQQQMGTALQNVKSKLPKLSRGKVLTLVILLVTLIVVILALNLMSQKQKEQEVTAPDQTPVESPQASTNPSNEEIARRVNEYNAKLDNMQNYSEKLQYPIVDLEISFEK